MKVKFLALGLLLGLGMSCSSKTVSCTGNSDCLSSTETCQQGTCQAQIGGNCKTNDVCSEGKACDVATAKCECGDQTHCGGALCIAQKCSPNRHIFLTSKEYTPGKVYASSGTTFASAADADQACKELAEAAGLGTKWMALIRPADTGTGAQARVLAQITNDNRPLYLLEDTTVIFAPKSGNVLAGLELIAALGNIVGQVNMTENKVAILQTVQAAPCFSVYNSACFNISGAPWTGGAGSNIGTCEGWTSNLASKYGQYGMVYQSSYWFDNNGSPCDVAHPLYCVEVDK